MTKQKQLRFKQVLLKKEITWTPEKFKDLLANVQQAIKSAFQFNNLELDDVELNYVVQEFLELMVQECNEYPGQWTFSNLQRVLGMMMPLDPHISIKQIHNIVPSAQALFEYLKQNDYINMDQYKLGLKAIANMQPSEDMLASLNRDERETQLVLSFINSNGIDTDDVDVAEAWMDDHKQEVADFMRGLLNPWGEYERKRLLKRQREMQQKQQVAKSSDNQVDSQLKRKKEVPSRNQV